MTLGVDLGRKGDGLGQQYNSPDRVVREKGCDVVIVGRGIIGAQDPKGRRRRSIGRRRGRRMRRELREDGRGRTVEGG
jgi:orotidine-5'-phosphate decarboxylase